MTQRAELPTERLRAEFAGHVVASSDDTHPDLFWAIRGGGGNFGVVTRFRYRLHPADAVTGGVRPRADAGRSTGYVGPVIRLIVREEVPRSAAQLSKRLGRRMPSDALPRVPA
jgi:hypothetical protein